MALNNCTHTHIYIHLHTHTHAPPNKYVTLTEGNYDLKDVPCNFELNLNFLFDFKTQFKNFSYPKSIICSPPKCCQKKNK